MVLGEEGLRDSGLYEYIPKRTKWKDSKACSLAAQLNRDMNNWKVNIDNMSWEEKRLLIALVLKVAMLAIMDSTCYTFAGRLFKQMFGAGIGLRASACMAKIVMGLIDKVWAKIQISWELRMYLYFRYIDDLRLFLHPISPGWKWSSNGWEYDETHSDNRSPIERTKEEIKKSLNTVTNFIQFTTEGEEDFNGFLPTLDFQTKVQESGQILFKFFTKPMSNNITIQFGTGLAKNVIFSALRQELIRRMVNCCTELDWDSRLSIVSDFIQLLVNSGHRYAFIKSVTLQAITKYKYMLWRASLKKEDERYRPIYRSRVYDQLKRQITKMVEARTWFKGMEHYDKFKNVWKSSIILKQNRGKRRGCSEDNKNKKNGECDKDTLAAMFIPPSVNSLLLQYISEEEKKLEPEMDWRIKLVEQSGLPLGMCFIPRFPLLPGCPRGEDCTLCGNTAVKCSRKGVIYKATCLWCKHGHPDRADA